MGWFFVAKNEQQTVSELQVNEKSDRGFPVRARVIVIALVVLPFLFYWHIEMEARQYTFPTLMAPFYSVIFVVICVLGLSSLLRLIAPRWTLKSSDLIVLYVLLTGAVMWMSYDLFLPLVSVMSYAHFWAYLGDPFGDYKELFFQYLPMHLLVTDRDVLNDFYYGGSTLYTRANIQAWLRPSLWWLGLMFALTVCGHSISVLLRRRWTDHERLVYPIARVPFEIAERPRALFGNKVFWWGFGIAAVIAIVNGLHVLEPSVPEIPVKTSLTDAFPTEKPWSALARDPFGLPLFIYPWVVGLAFLMPLDLLWSCLLFFFLYKLQYLVGGMFGWADLPDYPWHWQQNIGAYTAIAVLAVWASRRHIKQAFLTAIGYGKNDDQREPLSYRWAFILLMAGLAFIFWFCSSNGMSPFMTVMHFGAHFAMMITLTRLRAEVGLPITQTNYIGPQHSLTYLFGTRGIKKRDLTWIQLFFWFNRDNRSYPMPHQQEAFTLAKWGNINARRLSFWMLTMMAVGMFMAFGLPYRRPWSGGLLDAFFKLGVSTSNVGQQINSFGSRAFNTLTPWLRNPSTADTGSIVAMAVGFLVTVLLSLLRTTTLAGSLNPLGYGLAFHIHMFWAAFFIAALAKTVLVRYGGLQVYQRATPFFLGLVIGDFMCGSGWNILSIIFEKEMYRIYY